MAYQTGSIRYMDSFKSIRHYRNAHDKKTYAVEKGEKGNQFLAQQADIENFDPP